MAGTRGDLNIDIGAELTKVEKALRDLQNDFKKASGNLEGESKKSSRKVESTWEKSLKSIGGYIAGAFATHEIARFAKEAVNLAAKAEGVEAAFSKLDRPDLLADLRKATRGTIDDLELMRQAVRANNFQVPLEQLGTFFEFATKRSAQTGESVDYLVNSIIDGIGRKSTLVMDNLGISAARLQQEIKKTGDFGKAAGNIIAEELENAGDVATTSAQKMDAVTASFRNLQKALGEKLLKEGEGLLSDLPDFLQSLANLMNTGMFSVESGDVANEAFARGMADAKKVVEDLVKEGDEYAQGRAYLKLTQDLKKAKEQLDGWKRIKLDDKTPIVAQENYVKALEEAIKNLPNLIESLKKKQKATEGDTEAVKAQKKAYEEMIKVQNDLLSSSFVTGTRPTSVDPKGGLGFGIEDIVAGDLEAVENLDAKSKEFFANRQTDLGNLTQLAGFFQGAMSTAFSSILQGADNFGDAIGQIIAQFISQIFSAIAAAAALQVIMAAIPGLGTLGLFSGAGSVGSGVSSITSITNSLNLGGQFVLRGSDLILSQSRAQNQRNRYTG